MSLRRPPIRKIRKKVPKPKKSLRKLKRKSVRPPKTSKRPTTTKLRHSKKKKTVRLGTCYAGLNCTGKKLLARCTKAKCKIAGGKSWSVASKCLKIK